MIYTKLGRHGRPFAFTLGIKGQSHRIIRCTAFMDVQVIQLHIFNLYTVIISWYEFEKYQRFYSMWKWDADSL